MNVGSGESKKGRTTNYVVVPSSYKVGDVGPRIQISSRESITVEKRKDCIKKMDVGTDGKLSFEDVIYWFCGVCKERIDFDSACCPICQRSKRDSSSISSVLLEIAENVCIAHDNQNTLPLLPALYRKCIPREVLSRVQMVVQGRRNKTTEEFTFHYDLDSLFYWQCHECTMSNSFRRWTCLACKKKVCCNMNDTSLFFDQPNKYVFCRGATLALCRHYFVWYLSLSTMKKISKTQYVKFPLSIHVQFLKLS